MIYANPDSSAAGTLVSETTFSNFSVDGVSIQGNVKTYVDSPAIPGPRVLKVVANKNLADSKGNTKPLRPPATGRRLQAQVRLPARMIFTRLPVQLQAMRYWMGPRRYSGRPIQILCILLLSPATVITEHRAACKLAFIL